MRAEPFDERMNCVTGQGRKNKRTEHWSLVFQIIEDDNHQRWLFINKHSTDL